MIAEDDESGDGGPLCRVMEVGGHPPTGLDDLIGATTVTVEIDGHEYRLIGAGVKHDQIVLFQQQDAGSALDIGPVWTMTDIGDGWLSARQQWGTSFVDERVCCPPLGPSAWLVQIAPGGHSGRNRRTGRHGPVAASTRGRTSTQGSSSAYAALALCLRSTDRAVLVERGKAGRVGGVSGSGCGGV